MDTMTIVLDDLSPANNTFIYQSTIAFFLNPYTTSSGYNLIVAPTSGSHLGISIVKV